MGPRCCATTTSDHISARITSDHISAATTLDHINARITSDHISATMTYEMWREEHFWIVSVFYLSNPVKRNSVPEYILTTVFPPNVRGRTRSSAVFWSLYGLLCINSQHRVSFLDSLLVFQVENRGHSEAVPGWLVSQAVARAFKKTTINSFHLLLYLFPCFTL
jgi:hypothetical protein